ncbi:MAG: DUF362 domain-containing protein [Terriglobales bacterium]
MTGNNFSRRELLKGMGYAALAAGASWTEPSLFGWTAPSAPVAIAKCKTYSSAELLATLDRMFDQLGGLSRIVKGKTVAIKINCTGAPNYRLGYLPLGDTHYTNPQVITATLHLMGRAGARRIRILESPWSSAYPLQETLLQADWDPRDMESAASRVEFENTNFLGQGKTYVRFPVPFGGYLYPAYELNHSYHDCDVFVSMAKLKEHETTGFTLSMKNCFGITPTSIYGESAGVDEPNENPKGGRGMLHGGRRQPPKNALPEKDPKSPREGGYRVPRAVVDLVAARPIDLQIVDGIRSMSGGEGPWAPGIGVVQPGVLIAGTNPVATDAVGLAVMGFDPMADRGVYPFLTSDNMLRLAEEAGLGTRDLKRIEVVGSPIKDVVIEYATPEKRNARISRNLRRANGGYGGSIA